MHLHHSFPETSFPGFEGAGTFSQPEIDWEEFDSVVYNLEKIEEIFAQLKKIV